MTSKAVCPDCGGPTVLLLVNYVCANDCDRIPTEIPEQTTQRILQRDQWGDFYFVTQPDGSVLVQPVGDDDVDGNI